MQNLERRDDLGQKLLIGLLLGGFGTCIGFFINVVWGEAHTASSTANNAVLRVAVLESQYVNIVQQLTEIKLLIKNRKV